MLSNQITSLESAMDSELEALEQNKTWTIEKLPPKKKALGCKWVYKIKYKSGGLLKDSKPDSIEVARAKEGIFLCQPKYALDIIFEVGLLGAKPAKIPMEQNHHLGLAQGRLFEDPKKYQRFSFDKAFSVTGEVGFILVFTNFACERRKKQNTVHALRELNIGFDALTT
ncbi:copia protein, partial [Tanacetum coccineum]